jgi:septum formation protein
VEFEALNEAEVAAYVASGESMDKAGGYGVQGLASRFVRHIEGSYTSVVGLPVARVYAMLEPFESAGWPVGSPPFGD